MSDIAKIRAELELIGQEGVAQLKARLNELNASGADLAASLGRDEISAAEFDAEAKRLSVSIKNLEQSIRALEAAQDRQIESLGEQVQLETELAAASDRLAAANAAQAANDELAHKVELESMAIQHEIAMLEHEERQLRATRAAEDALVDTVGRSIQADLAASNATEALTTDRAQATIALVKEIDFERLDASLKRQEAQAARELADAEEDAAAAIRHETEILGIRTTRTGQYGSAVVNAGASTRNWGLAALEASRGIEDMQYGVSGAINNIPTLTMMLGGSAGLTAAISLFAVGTAVAVRHWDDLMGAFGKSSPIPDLTRELDELEKQIKSLEDKKMKLAVDYSDLDIAKRKQDDLKRGQAELDAQAKKQNVYQAESGKLIDELITESPAGAGQVAKRARDDMAERAKANSATIREAKQQEAQARQDLADAAEVEVPTFGEGGGDMMAGARKRIDAAVKKRKATEADIDKKSGIQYGNFLDKAKNSPGDEQRRNREDLAQVLRDSGQGVLADQIAGTTPESLQQGDEEDKRFNERMERARTAGERRRAKAEKAKKDQTAAQKSFTDTLKDELDMIKGGGDLEEEAKRLREAAVQRGAKDRALFESVRAGTEAFLRNRLKAILASAPANMPAGNGPLQDAAIAAAKDARLDQVRAEGAAARNKGAADKKDAKGQDKVQEAEFQAEAARVRAKLKAEADRIHNAYGKDPEELIKRIVAANPMDDPNELATRFAAHLTQDFRFHHATAGGANLAARQMMGRAGFDISLQDLTAQQRLINPPGAAQHGRRRQGPGMRSIAPTPEPGLQQLGNAQGDNQAKLMQIAGQHNGAIGALLGRQRAQAQGIDGLLRDASRLRQQATNQGTALNFGR